MNLWQSLQIMEMSVSLNFEVLKTVVLIILQKFGCIDKTAYINLLDF